ncbi:YciI family protein [Rhodobacter sp. NTK016B]|uniref:YciI family protein n=1 Tax=Rhodobacter sp. NTK016B TaxID=2759676 RepID=UPI001A8D0210|nr:YciI family protein [Rhodobacter sp. NTK016B]MBN8293537.1 YciI family protein [Rhodobacter sp. NTK016B]
MPLFALICTDKAECEELRKTTRDEHLGYLNTTGKTVMAGPFLEDGHMTGSLVVIDVADRAEAEDWAANDPYARAGLFAKVRIEEWKKVIG